MKYQNQEGISLNLNGGSTSSLIKEVITKAIDMLENTNRGDYLDDGIVRTIEFLNDVYADNSLNVDTATLEDVAAEFSVVFGVDAKPEDLQKIIDERGEITFTTPASIPISIPNPPNSPFVSVCISLKSSGLI